MKQTGISSIFSLIPSLFNKVDVNVINRYNQAIQDGCNHEQAYQAALTDTSGAMIKCNGITQDAISAANGQSISLNKLTLKSKAAALGMKALNWAMSTLVMVGVSWAISSIANAIQEYQANLEKARQETIEAGKVADETNDKLQEYIATYHELAKTGGSADQLKDLQQQIADLVGIQADNLDLVNGKLDDELEKLRQISIEQAQKNKGDLTGALVSAEQDLEAAKGSGAYSGYSHRFFKIDDSLLNNSGFMSLLDSLGVAQKYSNTGEFTGSFTFAQDSAENLYKSYQACVQAVTYMKDNMEPELLKESALYNDLTAQIGNYSEAAKAYGDALNAYNQNEAIIAVGENLKTFTGEINDQTSFDNWVKGIIEAEGATGDYANAIWDVCESRYPQFKRQTDEAGDSAYKASFQIQSLSNSLSELEKISDKFSKLGSAISELKEDGYVSIKTINEIAEAFEGTEGLDNYISQIATASNTAQLQNSIQGLINSYLNQESVLKGLNDANKQVLITQLQRLGVTNAEEVVNAKINQNLPGLTQNMKDFSKMTTNEATSLYALAKGANIAATELEKYLQILEKTKEIERLYAEMGKSQAYDSHIYAWRINNIRKDIANIVDSINVSNMDTDVKIKISMSGLEDLSGSGDKKTAEEKRQEEIEKQKEKAESEIAELKYKLETNKITEEKYLKDLDSVYKSFYDKTADYLEDYAKYSQEVYDGFKDMYKEDLEAQKEAWEKKKDAVSEYYDKLREEIENTHDEEDYEKEQSEKRKEIFDLDMQIAELMRDGSEKAKARIAELEEERLKAEEELRDFETDKARENELSRLEKEQKAEEDKIQQQIDGIQGQLDKLDKDTISVRNAIIAYARSKGVTLDFAYASGTRSSVGGFGRINEKGIEMISAPDGNGNYVNLMPSSYVFSAKATEFLWKLATEHSLPQAMYNSIAKSIKTQSSTPSVNIAQPITITMGDIIIKGNADKQTVADIKKQQDNTVRMVLQKIKELQK